jgi:hypothetical protein
MAADGLRVYIWPYGGLGHFGHAAVRLKHNTLPGGKCYISWWPGGGGEGNAYDQKKDRGVNKVTGLVNAPLLYQTRAQQDRTSFQDRLMELSDRSRQGLVDGTFQPRTGQREIDVGFQLGQDLMTMGVQLRTVADSNAVGGFQDKVWVQDPVKTTIPALGDPNVKVGLDVVKIFQWWQVFSIAPGNWYRLMSTKRNCAGVAALALRAGGGARFAKPPRAYFFMEPNHVQDWVDRINKALVKLNSSAKTVAEAGANYAGNPTNTEIMTVADWKTASSQGVSKLAVRSAATKKIDQLIKQYWDLGWGDATNDMFDLKVEKLVEMLDACHEYLATRAGHKRTDAVVTLGEQALGAICNHVDPRTGAAAGWN